MCLFVCGLFVRVKQSMNEKRSGSQVEETAEIPRRLDTEAEEHQQRAARDHRQVEGQLVAGRLGVGRGGISLPREIDCEDVEKAV